MALGLNDFEAGQYPLLGPFEGVGPEFWTFFAA